MTCSSDSRPERGARGVERGQARIEHGLDGLGDLGVHGALLLVARGRQPGPERRDAGQRRQADVGAQDRESLAETLAARHDAEQRLAGDDEIGRLASQLLDDILRVGERRPAPRRL